MTDISRGTRVHHRRYPWMVGEVTEGPYESQEVFVLWQDSPDKDRCETLADLRATPYQPNRKGN